MESNQKVQDNLLDAARGMAVAIVRIAAKRSVQKEAS